MQPGRATALHRRPARAGAAGLRRLLGGALPYLSRGAPGSPPPLPSPARRLRSIGRSTHPLPPTSRRAPPFGADLRSPRVIARCSPLRFEEPWGRRRQGGVPRALASMIDPMVSPQLPFSPLVPLQRRARPARFRFEVLMSVLLNTRQAAAHCNLSPRTLEKLRVKGGGPHFLRLGGAVRYQLEDLDLWILSSRRRTTSDPPPAAATSPGRSAAAAVPGRPSLPPAPAPPASDAPKRRARRAPAPRPPDGRTPRSRRRSRPRHPRRSGRS